MNYSEERNNVWIKVEKADSFFIYGAQIISYGVYKSIQEVLHKKPEAFLVSSRAQNPSEIDHIPVLEISGNISDRLVIVAVPEIYHEEIKSKLDYYQLKDSIYVDTHVEYLFMSRYFQKINRFLLLEDMPVRNMKADLSGVNIYMARYHKDPVLKRKYILPTWIQPVQVGASQTEQQIAVLQDNTGDNISDKNNKYSELSAMYWAWKNRNDDFLGICHYRRILILEDDDIRKIKQNHINVVLPLPFVCYPNTSGQYGRYINADDQLNMFLALKEISSEYFTAAESILKEPYLYNYNMFLADHRTFHDFCEWLFPILKRAEELCEPKGIVRSDRYIGYIGEVLTAIYFLFNKDNLKIAHAEKKWMV